MLDNIDGDEDLSRIMTLSRCFFFLQLFSLSPHVLLPVQVGECGSAMSCNVMCEFDENAHGGFQVSFFSVLVLLF